MQVNGNKMNLGLTAAVLPKAHEAFSAADWGALIEAGGGWLLLIGLIHKAVKAGWLGGAPAVAAPAAPAPTGGAS